MTAFLREHMRYVHGAPSSSQKLEKKETISSPSVAKRDIKKSGFNIPKNTTKGKRSNRLLASSGRFTPYADSDGIAECVLCKERMPVGLIEAHLLKIHRVTEFIRQGRSRARNKRWIHVVQGGLPSLGKKSR